MIPISGVAKDYAWGRVDGLVPWGVPPSAGPQAELWFGAHSAGPSPVRDGSGSDLREHVPGGHLDVLVKVLVAALPLSIQVHPDTAVIAAMQADPHGASLLSDDAVKAEMLVALEDFEMFAGFREPGVMSAYLAALGRGLPTLTTRAEVLAVIAALLADPVAWPDALAAAAGAGIDVDPLVPVSQAFSSDRAAGIVPLLHVRRLEAGDAVFVPAGTVHAYIQGLGVEVMVSGDNVLRLGLTPKVVDVPWACAATDPHLMPVVWSHTAETMRFEHPAMPFVVDRWSSGRHAVIVDRPRTILCVTGSATVHATSGRAQLEPGDALVVLPADGEVVLEVTGVTMGAA